MKPLVLFGQIGYFNSINLLKSFMLKSICFEVFKLLGKYFFFYQYFKHMQTIKPKIIQTPHMYIFLLVGAVHYSS